MAGSEAGNKESDGEGAFARRPKVPLLLESALALELKEAAIKEPGEHLQGGLKYLEHTCTLKQGAVHIF